MPPPSRNETKRAVVLAVDAGRKLLRAEFSGVVSAEDTRAEVERIPSLLETLGPGFTLLTDLTDLSSMEIDCVPHLTRMMDQCRAGGVAKVVRIIPEPDKDIGFGLLSLTHYRGKVPIATVTSRTEAERELASTPTV